MFYLILLQDQEIPGIGISAGTLTIIIIAAVVLITLVTLIPMILIFKKVFGNIRKTNALLANGEPGQARILKIWDTGTTVNDNPQVGLVLEVHAANRAPYQVETKCLISRLRIPQVQPGAFVNVKIDRQDTTQVALDLN